MRLFRPHYLPTHRSLNGLDRRPAKRLWLRFVLLGLTISVLGFVGWGSHWLTTETTLAQGATPIVISNERVTSITSTSVVITWDTNIPTTASQVSWGITTAYGQSSPYNTAMSLTHSVTLSGLNPATTYHYQMYVWWATPYYSGDYTFTTLPTGGGLPANGQAQFTAVNIVSTSATNANLSFSYTSSISPSLIRYQVSYGTTAGYGADTVLTGLDAAGLATNTQAITLLGLTVGTTYHFTIKLFNAGSGELLVASADRTFTTANNTGDSSLLLIERIRVDCVNTSCSIYFATTKAATVEARWDSGPFPAFTSYGTGTSEGSPSDTFRSINIPTATQTPFTPNTKYHYRLQASGTVPNESFTTGDLTFTTSASATDHVFATGQCSAIVGNPPTTVSVDIGSCLGSSLCAPAGILVSDCTQCGYLCDSGKTCRAGSPVAFCEADRALTGAPTQCNSSSCFDPRGGFISPAPAACVSSWPRCNANTILKVRNDRGCNLWLSCATSLQTDGSASGPGENLCLNLGACNSLNTSGQCNNYLPLGQCNNDPLRFCNSDTDCQAGGTCNAPDPAEPTKALQNITYQTPKDVGQLANLSGNVVAGLDWSEQGGANVIQGSLPWQLMRQIGGDAQIKNGDFEFRPPEVTPWNPVPENATPSNSLKVDFEDKDNSSNHVLVVEPVTQYQDATQVTQTTTFSGAATNSFTAAPSEYYYAEARVRGDGGSPVVRVQFGHSNYSSFSVGGVNTYVDVPTTAAWQRVTLGPLKGMSGATKLAFVCADNASCGKFQIDDVIVKPILQVNTNPSYIAPTCRLYPKNDSPSCDYASDNGILYKGWKGYCLEHDSQTGTCLSWWPVDIIKGESSIFGSEKAAGYQDRAPLYLCAQSGGPPYSNGLATNIVADACTSGCQSPSNGGISCVPVGATGICLEATGDIERIVPATGSDADIFEQDLVSISLAPVVIGAYGDNGWPSPNITATDIIPSGNATKSCGRYSGKNWSVCMDGIGGGSFADRLELWFEFDPTDGRLIYIHAYFNDSSSNAGGAYYRATFNFKDRCSALVQVVDQSGNSSAFASRVGSSVYKVPDLEYGLSTDLSPFGGVYPPKTNSTNPNLWPLLHVEQPNYTVIQAPGQARAGNPYACKGACTDIICSTPDPYSGVNNSSCLTGSKIDSTKVNNCQAKGGECIGLASSAGSAKGVQNFSSTLTTGDSYFAQERMKRLFAQSFGVWSDRRCSNSSSVACVADSDCGLGSCTVKAGSYLQVNNSSPNTSNTFVGWKRPTQLCGSNPAYQASVCASVTQQCNALLKVSGTSTNTYNSGTPNDADLKKEAIIAAMTQCGLEPVAGATIPITNGSVITGTPISGGKVACNGANADCSSTPSSTTLFTTFTLTDACSLRDRKYTCSGNCTATGTYENAAKPTFVAQSRYLRPTYVAGSQADYCAIPPEVFNAKFTTGTATTATITGGSGNIGIKFNTSADKEQVPLSNIRIDWGDTQDEFAFPYAPRNDTSKPHIFSHTYVVNRGDTSNCDTVNGRTTCEFPIKIQVEDSWEWCNDADATKACYNGSLSNNKKDSSRWFDTGLKVIVQP